MNANMLVYNFCHDKLQSMCIILRVCAISTHILLLVSNGAANMSMSTDIVLLNLVKYFHYNLRPSNYVIYTHVLVGRVIPTHMGCDPID